MITFFPTPYPEEILYSVFARYHDKSPNFNGSETAKDLFSVDRLVTNIEFPSRLVNLLRNMPVNRPYDDVDELITKHTLFPYYTVFLSATNKELIWQYMLYRNVDIYNKVTGILNTEAENQFLRFCPECNKEAKERYGELYWQRFHQIRGLFICPIHKIPIYNSTVSTKENSYKYIAANEENCSIKNEIIYEPKVYEKLLLIAEDMYWMLNNSNIYTNIKEQYQNQLKILEYSTVNGSLRQKTFINDFENFWGKPFLELIKNTITKTNNSNWLLEMCWNKSFSVDSLKNLLLMRFLGQAPKDIFHKVIEYKPFGQAPYPCLNPICMYYEEQIIDTVEVRNSYKTKSPIGYFTCPECGFSYLRRGPDINNEDRYRYSRIVDYGDYWRNELMRLLKIYSVPKVAKIMGTTHTTVYTFLKKNGFSREII